VVGGAKLRNYQARGPARELFLPTPNRSFATRRKYFGADAPSDEPTKSGKAVNIRTSQYVWNVSTGGREGDQTGPGRAARAARARG
jgi:hypothetical protein